MKKVKKKKKKKAVKLTLKEQQTSVVKEFGVGPEPEPTTTPVKEPQKEVTPAKRSPQHPTFGSNGLRIHHKPPKKPSSGSHVHWPSSPEEMNLVKEIPNENRGTKVPRVGRPFFGMFDDGEDEIEELFEGKRNLEVSPRRVKRSESVQPVYSSRGVL